LALYVTVYCVLAFAVHLAKRVTLAVGVYEEPALYVVPVPAALALHPLNV
jgi:hypothetical protein